MTPSEYYSATAGYYDKENGFHIWGILGTIAMSQPVPAQAVDYLKTQIQSDGGWEWNAGFGSDTNTTALAIQALIAAGEKPTATQVISGLNFIKSAQNPDGGFCYDPDSPWGTDSDTNSTSYAVQAVLAGSQDPLTGTWTVSNTNPISYLLSMQQPDGSFLFQPGLSGLELLATEQAIPALLGRVQPFKVADLKPCPAAYLPTVHKGP
jgi:prenyltransferase beta subunit